MRPSATAIAGFLIATAVCRADAPAGKELRKLEAGKRGMHCVALSPDGKLILTGGGDRVARLWDAAKGEQIRAFEQHHTPVASVAFSADGKHILTGSGGHDPDAILIPGPPPPPYDNVIRMFEVESGKEIRKFEGHTNRVVAVAFSGNGDRVLSGSADATVREWDLKTGKELSKSLVEKTHQMIAIAFSADRKIALIAHAAGAVKVWDINGAKEVRQLDNSRGIVWCLALSPDGKFAATGGGYHNNPKDGKISYYGTAVRLWNLETGKLVHTLEGHETCVLSVAFSPDGKRIVSGSGAPYFPRPMGAIKEVVTDNSIRVWDAATGKELLRCAGHTDFVAALAVGSSIISLGNDSTLRIWEMPK